MKILIVDDEPKIRTGMHHLLSRHEGWQVEAFADARSALDHISEQGADVVITDITMPEMNGLDMLEEIHKRNPLIPLFILSGYSRFEYAQRAIELNVKKYFTKPTDPMKLIEALESLECSQQKQVAELHTEVGESHIHNLQVLRAIDYMEQHYAEKLSLADVARAVYISPNYLSDLFRKNTGCKFSDYLLNLRMKRAEKFLREPNFSVGNVAQAVGFVDSRYFSSAFKKYSGMTPREYRNGYVASDKTETE